MDGLHLCVQGALRDVRILWNEHENKDHMNEPIGCTWCVNDYYVPV